MPRPGETKEQRQERARQARGNHLERVIGVEPQRITIECEEDGFWLVLRPETDERPLYGLSVKIEDPEAFYDHVKAAILPWLMERDAAKAEYDRARRSADTRSLTDEEFSAYVDDAYGDDFSKRVGMEQMREQGYA